MYINGKTSTIEAWFGCCTPLAATLPFTSLSLVSVDIESSHSKKEKKTSLKLWPLTRSYFPPHCARPRSLSHPITRQDGRLLLTPPNTVRCRWHAVAMRPRLGERMLWICATRFQRITEDWPLALNPQFLDNLSFFRASYWAEKFTPSRVKMQSEDSKRFETVWFYVSEPVKKST